MIVSFGSGVIIGTRSDIVGATPYNFGKIQEMQMDISYTMKTLYGQQQFPLDIARGQGKVTCKAKTALISGAAFGAFFLGTAATAGQNAMQFGEAGTVSAPTTITSTGDSASGAVIVPCTSAAVGNPPIGAVAQFTGIAPGAVVQSVTPGTKFTLNLPNTADVPSGSAIVIRNNYVVANSATFLEDLGVVYAATGLALTNSGLYPSGTGTYSVSNGVYSFSAGDNGANILVSYRYTISATGQQFTMVSNLIGTTPTFSLRFMTTKNGKAINVALHNCVSNKYTFQTKLEDYTIPEFDFECFADSAGNVLDWSYAEVS